MPTLAAVDIGSNSVRLKISRLSGRRLLEIHEDRQVTRLGDSVFRNGFLSPDAIDETVKALRRFHRAIQHEGADTVRVVATSALRDARNSRAFLEWVRSATGWRVEIISGLEEARLIHLGLVSSLRVSAATTLMVDLGGGSCELTISGKGHIQRVSHARSTPKGGAATLARICGKRNWADFRPDCPLSAKNRDRDLGHGSFPGCSLSRLVQDEGCACYRRLARPDATHCKNAGTPAHGRAQETFRSRTAAR
jgi:exopolyphosphatase/pppGpp-phosphohydrolase